uniref:Uncharacterized protein n=1 Tax=Romanomermis culicivorax TaxID=13658 RepID=A0A915HNB8_ROMCU
MAKNYKRVKINFSIVIVKLLIGIFKFILIAHNRFLIFHVSGLGRRQFPPDFRANLMKFFPNFLNLYFKKCSTNPSITLNGNVYFLSMRIRKNRLLAPL